MNEQDNVALIQQRMGPVAKTILAGAVLAAQPVARVSGQSWTVVLSAPEGPLTVQASSEQTIRIARHLRPGDFVVIEATLVSRGARCEIRALLMISSRESCLPAHVAEETPSIAQPIQPVPRRIPRAVRKVEAIRMGQGEFPWMQTG